MIITASKSALAIKGLHRLQPHAKRVRCEEGRREGELQRVIKRIH
jgi:hypothetical protein